MLERDVFRGKYTIWATSASANTALLVALDIMKAECTTCEPVVLYGVFSYLGSSGSNIQHSTSPVGAGDGAADGRSGWSNVVPLPYYLHKPSTHQRDDDAIDMLRHICSAWALQRRKVVAIVVEPIISWTGHRLSKYFLHSLQRLATELKWSLVLDEVLTAFRLTGSLYCFELELEPDVVVIGKVMGFGMALLRTDLCTKTGARALRTASTTMPIFHLQYMHAMLLEWERRFDKGKLEQKRADVVSRICDQLGVDAGDVFGEGLLVCGPFFLNEPEILALQGAKNRLLLIADQKVPKDVTKCLTFDRNWKQNMEAMDEQLAQLTRRAKQCVYYKAAQFFATMNVSAATENALWDALAQKLAIGRVEAKCLFRQLNLIYSERKYEEGASKMRARTFSFRRLQ